MLLDLDQSTLANMTAALDFTYSKLLSELDTTESRKRIADAITEAAVAGRHDFNSLCDIGLDVLACMKKTATPQRRFDWFGFRRSK